MAYTETILDSDNSEPIPVTVIRDREGIVEVVIGNRTYMWTVEQWIDMVNITVSPAELMWGRNV